MVNNIEQIKTLLSFNDKFDFYIIEIIKRRKDNPYMKKGQDVLKVFYVSTIEEYEKLIPDIIKICEKENARAYIGVNKRNYKKISVLMIKRIAQYMENESYDSVKNVFHKISVEKDSDEDKKWIIDLDNDVIELINSTTSVVKLTEYIETLQSKTKKTPMMINIPTKNGYHLITRPFNLKEFSTNYPNIDVHKDRLTLIYCS